MSKPRLPDEIMARMVELRHRRMPWKKIAEVMNLDRDESTLREMVARHYGRISFRYSDAEADMIARLRLQGVQWKQISRRVGRWVPPDSGRDILRRKNLGIPVIHRHGNPDVVIYESRPNDGAPM